MTPLEETTDKQRRAATPALSSFVMANAGAGKTRVLTNRVARLLIEKVDPAQILCVTFTKAAAAEMAERLFDVLGAWALAEDTELVAALKELEGEARRRDAAELGAVRKLFARALETPGGLKIQTIHSFCESILRRFPIEAGAAPGFTVIEESQARELIERALDRLGAAALSDPALRADLERLGAAQSEKELRDRLVHTNFNDIAALRARYENDDAAISALAAALGADPTQGDAAIKRAYIDSLNLHALSEARTALRAGGPQLQERTTDNIDLFFNAVTPDEKWAALSGAYLTQAGTPRSKVSDAKANKQAAWLEAFMEEQQQDFVRQHDRLKSQAIFADSAALMRVRFALEGAYQRAKDARAALDFNDLIARANALLTHTGNDWIMYKLDRGVDHILVDEAQDTSPDQWRAIEALLKDFLSGAGAAEAPRSFFAVGDMKQSIYSFQGADAGLFMQKATDLGARLAKATPYEQVDLQLSFRTTEPVLSFVDALFAESAAAQGLGGSPAHFPIRATDAGLVELWPLAPKPEKKEVRPWDAPVDEAGADDPVRLLTDRICATIKGWLDDGEELKSAGRPIQPGDVMILVQSRGALFAAVLEQLARAGVPVAGADRLKLLEDPAVEDLLSYLRFAAFAGDDLSLAEILKSPFFGFDDDSDLFPLAHGRARGKSLWAALCEKAGENERWRAARDELAAARQIGRNAGPYAFLTHILQSDAPSGRRKLYERLTPASRDAIDETLRMALEFETGAPRSLNGFIAWFTANAGEIKREMERGENCVRVMTVHAAKGLEANIVFLLDAQRNTNTSKLGPIFKIDTVSGLEALSSSAASDNSIIARARDEAKLRAYEENRRLLYVAATRARDRLYICGVDSRTNQDKKDGDTKHWHALSADAFDRLGSRVTDAGEPFWPERSPARARRIESDQKTPPKAEAEMLPHTAEVEPPAWLHNYAAPERAPAMIAPSRLAGETDTIIAAPAPGPAYSPAAGKDAYFRGLIIHRLLELLPEIAPDRRSDAADRLLAKLAGDIDAGERARWRDETLRVLSDPAFAPVFAPGSLAEAPIVGRIGGPQGPVLSGQIDRLAIGPAKILVVDYKTNRPPPARIEDADPGYIAQLAAYRALLQEIYPNREIACALLWTFEARLMAVPETLLDHAFERYLRAG